MAHPLLRPLKSIALHAPYLGKLIRRRDELTDQVQRLGQELASQQAKATEQAEGRKAAYAHFGEDQVLAFLFAGKTDGFYVDIGAYHPNLYSNTRLLFERGWRGINVDCNPHMMALFRKLRPDDINLQAAVSREEGTVKYFLFHEWASSNTLSRDFADAISSAQAITVKEALDVPSLPLRTLLARHLPEGRGVDVLNVDVESLDLEVLQSNDWKAYRPLVVAVEDLEFDMALPTASPIYNFLREQGYRCISRTTFTNFFVDETRKELIPGCPSLAPLKATPPARSASRRPASRR